jgi:hypothetical protein
MRIKLDKRDILNFAIGEDNYHPLERSLDRLKGKDHRYETFETFIYDSKYKQRQAQNADYVFFYKEVVRLRLLIQEGAKISGNELLGVCEELLEIAPSRVELPSAPFDCKGDVPQDLQKRFSTKGKIFGDIKRDSSDDE